MWLSHSTVEPLNENQPDFINQSAASAVSESAAEVVKKVKAENSGTKRQLGKSPVNPLDCLLFGQVTELALL